jgi:hypothetical protein
LVDFAGNKIKCEKEVKLLGVAIDFELKFNSHISNICKKASRQLNVLKRLGKYLNNLGKLTISLNRVSFLPPPVRNNIFYEIETSSTGLYNTGLGAQSTGGDRSLFW